MSTMSQSCFTRCPPAEPCQLHYFPACLCVYVREDGGGLQQGLHASVTDGSAGASARTGAARAETRAAA